MGKNDEINLFHYIAKVTELCQSAVKEFKSHKQLHDEISLMCVDCLRSMDKINECEMCMTIKENTEEKLKDNLDWFTEKI